MSDIEKLNIKIKNEQLLLPSKQPPLLSDDNAQPIATFA